MLICTTLLTNRVGTQVSMRIGNQPQHTELSTGRGSNPGPLSTSSSRNPRPRLPSLACVELTLLVVNFSQNRRRERLADSIEVSAYQKDETYKPNGTKEKLAVKWNCTSGNCRNCSVEILID